MNVYEIIGQFHGEAMVCNPEQYPGFLVPVQPILSSFGKGALPELWLIQDWF